MNNELEFDIEQLEQIDIEEAICETEGKKIPKTRNTTRSLEAILEASTKSLSQKECELLIDHLRSESCLYRNKYEQIKAAFEAKAQETDTLKRRQTEFKQRAITQIRFFKETIGQAYKTMLYAHSVEEDNE